jgi:hypothetical protein
MTRSVSFSQMRTLVFFGILVFCLPSRRTSLR